MRVTFSLIFLNLVLCTFVSAFSKRAVSAPTQQCITIIVNCGNQITTVRNGVSAYTASQGYAGALAVQSQETTLESIISNMKTICCSITSVVSNEDALALLSQIDPLTTQIESLLSIIVSKKSVFDSVSLVTSLIKGDISSLKTKFGSVITCWIVSVPSPYSATLDVYITRINTAFSAAVAAYA